MNIDKKKIKFPYEITRVEGKLKEELSNYFIGEKGGYVQVGPKKWLFPGKYAAHAEGYYNFELRPDDIWIMTYPRSGTTWVQEIIWLINNNLDYETAQKIPVLERSPFFEMNMIFGDKHNEDVIKLNGNDPDVMEEIRKRDIPGYILCNAMKSPRLIKTHLPASLLPPNLVDTCKIIYIARNPLDVAVSFYHHNKLFLTYDFQGDFEKYWELFQKDLIQYSPYWEHIKEGWENKEHPNFLFLFYEDLLRDPSGNIKKLSKFLNKQMTDDEIKNLAEFIHIDNFRKHLSVLGKSKAIGVMNPKAQHFVRRGKIGGNEEFNTELKVRAKKWFKENLAKTNIKFPEF